MVSIVQSRYLQAGEGKFGQHGSRQGSRLFSTGLRHNGTRSSVFCDAKADLSSTMGRQSRRGLPDTSNTYSSFSPPLGETFNTPLRKRWEPRAGRLTTRILLCLETCFLDARVDSFLIDAMLILCSYRMLRGGWLSTL